MELVLHCSVEILPRLECTKNHRIILSQLILFPRTPLYLKAMYNGHNSYFLATLHKITVLETRN